MGNITMKYMLYVSNNNLSLKLDVLAIFCVISGNNIYTVNTLFSQSTIYLYHVINRRNHREHSIGS